ncbi:MAG: peptidylprolyl isomerase [Planctomycetes bacterium]|nr:peptidylprolyl isomerase [Planctomycetota bacterium]
MNNPACTSQRALVSNTHPPSPERRQRVPPMALPARRILPHALSIILALVLTVGCHRTKSLEGFHPTNTPSVQTENVPIQPTSTGEQPFAPQVNEGDGMVSLLVINGQTITVDEILDPIRNDLAERAQAMPPERYGAYLVDRLEGQVRVLARDALLHHAAAKGLTDQEQEGLEKFVDQAVRDRINEEFGGRQTRYEDALAQEDRSMEDDREGIRRELLISRWLQQTVVRRVTDPTRDELWNFYEERKESLSAPPRRRMLLVEIPILAELPKEVNAPTQEQLQEARAAARAKAAQARSELLAGAEFAKVAMKYSKGLYAQAGGRWGWVTRDGVRERWAPAVKALFDLPAVDVPSDIVETPESCFIVQAAAIETARRSDFESIQPQLTQQFREAQFRRLVEEEVSELHDNAHIEPRDVGRFLRAVAAAAPQPSGERSGRGP